MSFIQFGDLPPEILESKKPEVPGNQDPGESNVHHSQSASPADEPHESPTPVATTYIQPPLSAQLRYFKNPPITRTPLPAAFSTTHPPLTFSPPQTAVNRHSNVVVPLAMSPDNRLVNIGTYLSNESLLPKMYKRWCLLRAVRSYAGINITEVQETNLVVLGTPVDYWLTFPLKPPEISADGLESILLTPNQEPTIVSSAGPIKSTRVTLNLHPGTAGPPPPHNDRPFPWVDDSTGTKMCSCTTLVKWGFKRINGFVECPKCNNIWGIGYGIGRLLEAEQRHAELVEKITAHGPQALQMSHFKCKCDGKENGVRPLISNDYRKINWMCLFLGLGLGYCTMDQLDYYCKQRKLEVSAGNMNLILLRVCTDLIQQIGAGESLKCDLRILF